MNDFNIRKFNSSQEEQSNKNKIEKILTSLSTIDPESFQLDLDINLVIENLISSIKNFPETQEMIYSNLQSYISEAPSGYNSDYIKHQIIVNGLLKKSSIKQLLKEKRFDETLTAELFKSYLDKKLDGDDEAFLEEILHSDKLPHIIKEKAARKFKFSETKILTLIKAQELSCDLIHTLYKNLAEIKKEEILRSKQYNRNSKPLSKEYLFLESRIRNRLDTPAEERRDIVNLHILSETTLEYLLQYETDPIVQEALITHVSLLSKQKMLSKKTKLVLNNLASGEAKGSVREIGKGYKIKIISTNLLDKSVICNILSKDTHKGVQHSCINALVEVSKNKKANYDKIEDLVNQFTDKETGSIKDSVRGLLPVDVIRVIEQVVDKNTGKMKKTIERELSIDSKNLIGKVLENENNLDFKKKIISSNILDENDISNILYKDEDLGIRFVCLDALAEINNKNKNSFSSGTKALIESFLDQDWITTEKALRTNCLSANNTLNIVSNNRNQLVLDAAISYLGYKAPSAEKFCDFIKDCETDDIKFLKKFYEDRQLKKPNLFNGIQLALKKRGELKIVPYVHNKKNFFHKPGHKHPHTEDIKEVQFESRDVHKDFNRISESHEKAKERKAKTEILKMKFNNQETVNLKVNLNP